MVQALQSDIDFMVRVLFPFGTALFNTILITLEIMDAIEVRNTAQSCLEGVCRNMCCRSDPSESPLNMPSG